MESEFDRLRKKVENYPSASAYNRLAELARMNQDDAEAERICQRCIKEFPRNGQAYVVLAEIALGSGKREEALKHLHNAIERDSRSYAGHRLLAELYATEHPAKALHHLRQILVFRPNDPPTVQKIEQISRAAGATGALPPAQPMRQATPLGTPIVTPGAVAALPAKATTSPASRTAAFSALCSEHGVRGAVIADHQGRVVVTQGLPDGHADLLAALAAEITAAATAGSKHLGQDQVASWLVEGEQGQVLAFKRDNLLTLAVLADPGVRAALLELRARQALIDLGAA